MRARRYLALAELDGKPRDIPGVSDVPGVRAVLLMPTLEQFRKVHLPLMLSEIEGEWKFLGLKLNKSSLRLEAPGGSWMQVVSAEAAEGARGIRCDDVDVDECDDIEPSIIDAITNAWFTEPFSYRRMLLGGTPKRGRYGLLYRAVRKWPSDAELAADHFGFHCTSYDAPNHVDRNYIDRLKAKTAPAIFRREYLCDFDSAEGLVYDIFKEDFHVREPNKQVRFTMYLVGQDWGYEDPGVQIVFGVQGHGKDATVWALEETVAQHKTIDYWAENTKRLYNAYGRKGIPMRWFADPSRPDSIAAINERVPGVNIVPAQNAIDDGVACVADKMLIRERRDEATNAVLSREARFYVSPKCREYIAELGLYRRKRDSRDHERVLDAIEDKNNHCLVGSTLVTTYRGDIPIRDIERGDLVMTRIGWRSVLKSWKASDSAPIWRVTASNGATLEGTAEHEVWTENRGFVRIDSLEYGDIVATCRDGQPTRSAASASESSSTVEHIGATLNQNARSFATTSRRSAGTACTAPFGNIITERSQTAITSTTRMAIFSTTTSPTLNASRSTSMRSSTASGLCPQRKPQTSLECGSLQKRGTAATPDANGTESTPQTASPNHTFASPEHARNAANNTLANRDHFSATPIAARRSGASPESTTNRAPAQSAERYSSSTDIQARSHAHVVAVCRTEKSAPVYDLEVDEAHEFFANGILVHNCNDSARYALFSHFGPPDNHRVERGASQFRPG